MPCPHMKIQIPVVLHCYITEECAGVGPAQSSLYGQRLILQFHAEKSNGRNASDCTEDSSNIYLK
jgi:hypothetical protein